MHLIAASGLAEGTREWLDPYLAVIRETFEEIVVLAPRRKEPRELALVLPTFAAPSRQGYATTIRIFAEKALKGALQPAQHHVAASDYETHLMRDFFDENRSFLADANKNVKSAVEKFLELWKGARLPLSHLGRLSSKPGFPSPAQDNHLSPKSFLAAMAWATQPAEPHPAWLLPLFDASRHADASDDGPSDGSRHRPPIDYESLFDALTVRWSGCGTRTHRGQIVLDPQFAAIDLMGAVLLDLSHCTIDEIVLLDGEYGQVNTWEEKHQAEYRHLRVKDEQGKNLERMDVLLDRLVYVATAGEFANLFIPGQTCRPERVFQTGEPLGPSEGVSTLPPNPKMNPPLLYSGITLLTSWLAGFVNEDTRNKLYRIENAERSFVYVNADYEGK